MELRFAVPRVDWRFPEGNCQRPYSQIALFSGKMNQFANLFGHLVVECMWFNVLIDAFSRFLGRYLPLSLGRSSFGAKLNL